MKNKIFSILSLALVMSLTVACKSDKKADAQDQVDSLSADYPRDTAALFKKADPDKVGSGADIVNVEPTETVKLPVFSDETVNAGLAKFEGIRKELEAAVKAKDAAKMAELNKQFLQWATEASTYGSKLTQDENQLYIDTYTKLAVQWDKLMAKK